MVHIIPLSLMGIAFVATFAILSTTTTGAPFTQSMDQNRTLMTEESHFGTEVNTTGDSDARSKKSLSSLRCGWNYGIDVTNRRSKRRALFGGWQKENITYLIEKYSTKLSHQKVDKYIARAFDVWSQYTNLNFTAKKYWLVDIVIQFAENKHGVCQAFDGPGDVFGHASAPSRTYAYIHFDDAEDWSDERKFFEIAIHEIGHTLGLDHTSVSNSVMQKHYPFDLEGNSNLSLDDIEGIQALYGAKTKN